MSTLLIVLKLLSLHCLSQQSSWLPTQQSEQVTSCHMTNHSKQLITSPMSLPRSTLVLVGCVFTNTHVITHHNIILGWLLSNLLASSLTFQNWTIKSPESPFQPLSNHLSHVSVTSLCHLLFPCHSPSLLPAHSILNQGMGAQIFAGTP